MIDQRLQTIFLALSAALIAVSLYIGSELTTDIDGLRKQLPVAEDASISARLSLLNSAVKLTPHKNYFDYTGQFESPFRLQGNLFSRASGKAAVKIPRTPLALKGVLTKDRPIAILENAAGETFIRAAGEKAGEQTVVSIKDNRVTLRDHLGTYEIIVEER